FEERLALERARENRAAIADALLSLGGVIRSLGDPVTARALLREALASHQAEGNRLAVAAALEGWAEGERRPGRAARLLAAAQEIRAMAEPSLNALDRYVALALEETSPGDVE